MPELILSFPSIHSRINLICRDRNRFNMFLNLKPKHFAGTKVVWIIVIKDNKRMVPINRAEKSRFLVIAGCVLNDLFHEEDARDPASPGEDRLVVRLGPALVFAAFEIPGPGIE